jgi:hypothetical protein
LSIIKQPPLRQRRESNGSGLAAVIRSHKVFDITRNKIDTSASHVRRIRKMAEDEQQAERDQKVMRYRILEREVTDPLAAYLLRQIVSEMETDVPDKNEM